MPCACARAGVDTVAPAARSAMIAPRAATRRAEASLLSKVNIESTPAIKDTAEATSSSACLEFPTANAARPARRASHLDQRHLGHRAAGIGRPIAAAAGTGRLATRRARAALGLGLRKLLRLGRDRAVEELEAELAGAGLLVLDHDHPHMAAVLELAEQHLVGKRLLDALLDGARHRTGAH